MFILFIHVFFNGNSWLNTWWFSYKWTTPTYPIYNQGCNPLTIRGMSHQVFIYYRPLSTVASCPLNLQAPPPGRGAAARRCAAARRGSAVLCRRGAGGAGAGAHGAWGLVVRGGPATRTGRWINGLAWRENVMNSGWSWVVVAKNNWLKGNWRWMEGG